MIRQSVQQHHQLLHVPHVSLALNQAGILGSDGAEMWPVVVVGERITNPDSAYSEMGTSSIGLTHYIRHRNLFDHVAGSWSRPITCCVTLTREQEGIWDVAMHASCQTHPGIWSQSLHPVRAGPRQGPAQYLLPCTATYDTMLHVSNTTSQM